VLDQWQNIVDIMARIIGVPSAIITHVMLPEIEVVRASGNADNPYHSGQRAAIANHYCAEVVRTRGRVHVEDARASERWRTAPEIEYGMYAYLGLPIRWPSGDIFGTICVLDSKPNAYSPDFEVLIEQFRDVVETHLTMLDAGRVLEEKNRLLEQQLAEIKTLRGIIPICAACKKVRDGAGYWQQVELYVRNHSAAEFSHGLCPACLSDYCEAADAD
jgi:transcriptional regulator with GAF, ATPase, and Fis domain